MSRPLKWQPQLAPPLQCPLCLFPSLGTNTPTHHLIFPPLSFKFVYLLICFHFSTVPVYFRSPSLSSPLSTLYSLRVYISFTGKPSQFTPRQCLCCGECCPLFPAFYHLNISLKQFIYFLRFAVCFSFLFSSYLSSLCCPELATPGLRIKRNGWSGSSVEDETTGKAQNGTGWGKLDSQEHSVDVEKST